MIHTQKLNYIECKLQTLLFIQKIYSITNKEIISEKLEVHKNKTLVIKNKFTNLLTYLS